MNSAIEQGLKDFLATVLGATEQTTGEGVNEIPMLACTIDGASVSLHCNISNDTLPELGTWIIAAVREVSHVVGPIHKPQVTFSVSTPQNVAGFTEATHRAAVAALRAAFTPDHAAALNTAMLAAANGSCQSWFVESMNDSLGGDRWQTEMRLGLCFLE